MFGFLGFILILIVAIILIAFSILGSFVRALFGIGRRKPRTYTFTNESAGKEQSHSSNNSHTSEGSPSSGTGKKKIFGDDEGEYVDFEEIK